MFAFETVSAMLTVNKATVNANSAPLPDIFNVCIELLVPTVCWTKKTNSPSVTAVGFVTVKLLLADGVNIISVPKLTVSKAYCEFNGDTNIAQVTLDPAIEVAVLAPSNIDWGADPDNCNVVL